MNRNYNLYWEWYRCVFNYLRWYYTGKRVIQVKIKIKLKNSSNYLINDKTNNNFVPKLPKCTMDTTILNLLHADMHCQMFEDKLNTSKSALVILYLCADDDPPPSTIGRYKLSSSERTRTLPIFKTLTHTYRANTNYWIDKTCISLFLSRGARRVFLSNNVWN